VSGGGQEGYSASGAGHAIKALNNLMSAAHLLASSEALLAADHTEIARWLSARIDRSREP
jgi:3-hydroxyisobutyrate dehydrogenase-like beta-hydroxyacid dehydrogenase